MQKPALTTKTFTCFPFKAGGAKLSHLTNRNLPILLRKLFIAICNFLKILAEMQTSTASARQLSYRHPKATTNSWTNPARNPYILAETPWRKHAAQEAGWTDAACLFGALGSHSGEVSDSVFNSHYFQELLRTCQGTGNTLKHIPCILLNMVSVAFSWILCCLLLQASFRRSSVSYTVNRASLKQNGRYNCLKCCKPIHFNVARLSGKYVNLCWLFVVQNLPFYFFKNLSYLLKESE